MTDGGWGTEETGRGRGGDRQREGRRQAGGVATGCDLTSVKTCGGFFSSGPGVSKVI